MWASTGAWCQIMQLCFPAMRSAQPIVNTQASALDSRAQVRVVVRVLQITWIDDTAQMSQSLGFEEQARPYTKALWITIRGSVVFPLASGYLKPVRTRPGYWCRWLVPCHSAMRECAQPPPPYQALNERPAGYIAVKAAPRLRRKPHRGASGGDFRPCMHWPR